MTTWKEITLENDESTIWDREEPIEGRLVMTQDNVGPNDSKMYTLKTDDGDIKVWGSTVLDNKLLGIPQGALIRIVYKGKAKGKKGNSYHDFSVSIAEDDIPVIEEKSGYQKAKEARDAIKDDHEEEPPLEMPEGFLK